METKAAGKVYEKDWKIHKFMELRKAPRSASLVTKTVIYIVQQTKNRMQKSLNEKTFIFNFSCKILRFENI